MTGRSFIGVALVLGAFVGALVGVEIGSLWIGIGGGVVLGTVIGVLLDAGDKARSSRGRDGADGGDVIFPVDGGHSRDGHSHSHGDSDGGSDGGGDGGGGGD